MSRSLVKRTRVAYEFRRAPSSMRKRHPSPARIDADPRRLFEDADGDPGVRLEGGLRWIEFGADLVSTTDER